MVAKKKTISKPRQKKPVSAPKRNAPQKKVSASSNTKSRKELIFNLFSGIIILRLILVFSFIYMFFFNFPDPLIIMVFLMAASTELLDTVFANHYKHNKEVDILDHITYKTFLGIVSLSILFRYFLISQRMFLFILFLVVFAFAREIVSIPGFLYALTNKKPVYKTTLLDKTVTALQVLLVILIILETNFAFYLAVITCILGVFSGFRYLKYSFSKF